MKVKISYWLIGLFGVWCVAASQWYLFGIKGLQADPAHFRPHETTLGILEVAAILLITVLLGFGIAWFLRQGAIDEKETHIQNLSQKVSHTNHHEQELLQRLENAERALEQAQETLKEDFAAASIENERLQDELVRAQRESQERQEEIQMLGAKVQLADVELGRITMQFRQLENQVKQYEQKNQELKAQLNQMASAPKDLAAQLAEVPKETGRPRRLEKDDLKLIVGIGPKIEKKLNKLGVYTFEQIRDLTPEMMEQITTKLKSFPDRIARDNWVGQAKQLIRKASKA